MKEVIRDIMKYRGHTNETLSKKLGYSTPSGIGNVIARDDGMSVYSFLKIMRALNCEVVIHGKFDEDKDMEWKL